MDSGIEASSNQLVPAVSPFWFVRHGESEANLAGLIAGQRDSPLTASGHEQARSMAARLAHRRISRICSSPQRRALDTARQLAAATGAPLFIIEALRERNFGSLEGTPNGQVEDHFSLAPPGGETWPQFAARVREALHQECAASDGDPPVIVAHAGVYRVLLEWFTGERVRHRPANALPMLVDPSAAPEHWTTA